MKWIIAIVTCLVLNTILIVWGRGSFLAAVISLGTSFWIGLPLLILSCAFFSIAARKKSTRFMTISSSGIIAALIIFSTMLTIPIGNKIVEHDVSKAKAFCEALAQKMEKVKGKTGLYPKDISGVIEGAPQPHLFKPSWYHCDGTNYSFTIADPGTIMGGWSYGNQRKTWDYWD
jgi:hypothetical protein